MANHQYGSIHETDFTAAKSPVDINFAVNGYSHPKCVKLTNRGAGKLLVALSVVESPDVAVDDDWGADIPAFLNEPYLTTMDGITHIRIKHDGTDTAYTLYWENEA